MSLLRTQQVKTQNMTPPGPVVFSFTIFNHPSKTYVTTRLAQELSGPSLRRKRRELALLISLFHLDHHYFLASGLLIFCAKLVNCGARLKEGQSTSRVMPDSLACLE